MNERTPNNFSIEQSPQLAAYAAPGRATPDWRRLEVTTRRFSELIATGIKLAMNKQLKQTILDLRDYTEHVIAFTSKKYAK